MENIKKSYKNNKFKISSTKWSENFDLPTHPTTRRRVDIESFPFRHPSDVLNETPNEVLLERRKHVSVVRLNNVLLKCRDVNRT